MRSPITHRWQLLPALALAALVGGFAGLAGLAPVIATAQDDPLAEYHEMFGDDNPAELWEARGKELWEQPRAEERTLAKTCDLGLGAGVVAGAYARLPRHFDDTKRVQDLESRLLTCLERLGADQAELLKHRFGDGDSKSDLEALVAWLVSQSRGAKVEVSLEHPDERRAYELGRAIFFYRAGTHDFSCATCHATAGKRIRLQELPDLTHPEGARAAYTHWPAYRVSQGEFRTMEWRLTDCFRQQRLPELDYGSEAAVALTMYLAHNANGGTMTAPGLVR